MISEFEAFLFLLWTLVSPFSVQITRPAPCQTPDLHYYRIASLLYMYLVGMVGLIGQFILAFAIAKTMCVKRRTNLRVEQFRSRFVTSCFHLSPLSHSSLQVTSRCVTSRRRQPTTPWPSGVRWNHAWLGIAGSGQSITGHIPSRIRYTVNTEFSIITIPKLMQLQSISIIWQLTYIQCESRKVAPAP